MLKFHEMTSIGLLAGLLFTAGLVANHEPSIQETPGPASMRGLTRAEVLDRLGVPRSVSGSAGATVFHYSSSGEGLEVVFHDDRAVLVASPFATPESRGPVPDEGIHLGQEVRRFLEVTDAPADYSAGGGGLMLHFDSSEVFLVNGIVAGIGNGR